MIDSIYGRDYPVVQGLTIALAILVSLVFLLTDMVQASLDPRVPAMSRAVIGAGTLAGRRLTLPRPSRTLLAGALILGASLFLAVAPGLVAPFDPLTFDYNALLQAPSSAHLMGTDNFGRDVLSRC